MKGERKATVFEQDQELNRGSFQESSGTPTTLPTTVTTTTPTGTVDGDINDF